METVAQPPADAELHLLTEWGDPDQRSRRQRAAVLSVLAHAAVITILVVTPADVLTRPEETRRVITPLVEPIPELTQKPPTKGKITKEFTTADIEPRPRIQVPAGQLAPPKPLVPPPAPKPARPAALPEAPKVDAPVKEPPKPDLAALIAPQPPQIQTEEKPKITLQNVAPAPTGVPAGQSRVPMPDTTVSGAVRSAARGGPGGMVVSDSLASPPAGLGSGISLPPSPGSTPNTLQLLSDPLGVDFRPYLIRVLASVKQHWMAVIPESVRYAGRRGRVSIQFAIARDGNVPKLVIAEGSGADALDRAAVAGISASVPFPPLPNEYKGDRIVLQFNFAYNMPKP